MGGGAVMNYWPRWIGAIKKRTATLSLMQMGAYDRLLDHYYAEEGPLPAALDECYRITGALTKAEQEAVRFVLGKFFVLTDSGHAQERADDEIRLALPKIAAAQANGARGGRPKGSGKKPTGLLPGNPPATQDEPTSKAPHPHSSSPSSKNPPASRVPPAAAGPKPSKRCPESFAVTPELRAWAHTEIPGVDIDFETGAFRDWTFATARVDWPATWRGWMRKASKDGRVAKRHETPGETTWQRSQRERVAAFAPGVAAKAPGARATITLDMEAPDAAPRLLG